MSQTSLCLTPRILNRLSADELPPAELEKVEQHLDECASCRALLDEAAAEPAAWVELRVSLSEDRQAPSPADESVSLEQVLKLLGPTDDPRMLGRIGTYEIVGVLGRGGMGIVFKGFDAALNRYVAIKLLQPHVAAWGAARERFAREARAAAAVVDENVMAIHGVSEWQGLPFFVMPYTRGISLQKRLHDTGPLQLREILRIGMQTASGLAAAHAQGLVHRDVKPANILLADGVERVTLSDFGLARAVDDASVTLHGVVAGTPQYMSPEQARGQTVDCRSDLFSLGSVLYALCTGRPPFRAESTLGVLRLVIEDEPQPIRELNPDIPEWLCRIIGRLMAKRPENRYSSAREVADLLEKCLAHVQQPTAMPLPAELIPNAIHLPLSRRTLAMIFTALVGFIGLFLWQTFAPPDIAGEWQGEEWGRVTLKATGEGEYTGTYTDTFGPQPGEIRLKWSRIERRYSGSWREGDDRVGEISVRVVGNEVRGAWTADPKSKINPNTPHLADLLWTRPSAVVVARSGDRATPDAVVARSPDRTTDPTAGLPAIESEQNLGTTTQKVIDGMLARSAAISSGRIEYHLKAVIAGKVFDDSDYWFAFSGESWAKRYPPSENAAANHNSRLIQYWETPQKDGTISRSLGITLPESAFKNSPYPPVRAGTLWFPSTSQFIRSEANKARSLGAKTVNGVETLVLEWDVSAADKYEAFNAINEPLKDGGRLRIYVAPQLGFALPRIEHVDRFGTVQSSFDASDFKEAASQVFFPMKYVCDKGTYTHTYEIERIEQFNQPISNDEFSLAIPAGTMVADSRPKSTDKVDANGKRTNSTKEYPYRLFRTGAAYPHGFPAELLKELDRDLAEPTAGLPAGGPPGGTGRPTVGIGAGSGDPRTTRDRDAGPTAGLPKDPRSTGTAFEPKLLFRTYQKDAVTTLRFSPDGTRLAANNEHDFALYDARTGMELWSTKVLPQTLEAAIAQSDQRDRPREVRTLAFSPDGKWVVAGHSSGRVTFFDAETGRIGQRIREGWGIRNPDGRAIGSTWSLSFSPDGKLLAVCGDSKAAVSSTRDLGLRGDEGGLFIIFDVGTGEKKLDLLGQSSQGLDVAFSPDGKLLATAGNWSGPDAGSGVKLWDPQTGELKHTIPVEHTALSLAFSPAGEFLAIGTLRNDKATGFSQGNIYLVRPATGKVELVVSTPIAIRPLSFSPDGKLLAASAAKNAIRLWDVKTGQAVGDIQPSQTGPTVRIEYFAFAPSGLSLVIGGMDPQRGGFLEVWTLKGPAAAPQPASPPATEPAVGDQGSSRPKREALDPSEAHGKPLVLTGHTDWVTGVAFSPDGKRLASSSRDNTLKVWDAVTGQEQFIAKRSGQNILDGHRGYVESVAFSPDGKYLASVGDDHEVYLWNASTGQCACGWGTHKHIVMAVAYSPDGSRLATASSDNTVKVWDANPDNHRGGEILSLEHPMPLSVAFSPDGKRLASAGRDNTIRVWNPATAELLLTIKHTDKITCVTFSPDGTRLASAGPTGVQLWDAASGKLLSALPELTGISGVAYSPDGKRLASSGWDHVVRLWDTRTGQELLTLKGHGNSVGRLAFSPDGKRLASASHDRTVRIWDVTSGDEAISGRTVSNKQVRVTKEQVDGIKELIKDAPVTTSYLAEIWELVPGTQAEYCVRKDITAVELLPADDVPIEVKRLDFSPGPSKLAFVPLGTAYITVSKGVYLQWDGIGASTRHYYGPFYGDKLKRLGLSFDPEP